MLLKKCIICGREYGIKTKLKDSKLKKLPHGVYKRPTYSLTCSHECAEKYKVIYHKKAMEAYVQTEQFKEWYKLIKETPEFKESKKNANKKYQLTSEHYREYQKSYHQSDKWKAYYKKWKRKSIMLNKSNIWLSR